MAPKILKKFLLILGKYAKPNLIWSADMLLNYVKLGGWMQENGFYTNKRLPDRNAVFDSVLNKIKDEKVLYLEFGVKYGKSIKYWSDRLKNRESVLHGFDSFEGLPEAWDNYKFKKGTLTTEGGIPSIDDKRITFFKGWFNDTLPSYALPDTEKFDKVVFMLDADLYSSTSYVLNHFRNEIKEGVFLYFDEMNRPDHEPKAFSELIESTDLKFNLISADFALNRCFFECIGKKYQN